MKAMLQCAIMKLIIVQGGPCRSLSRGDEGGGVVGGGPNDVPAFLWPLSGYSGQDGWVQCEVQEIQVVGTASEQFWEPAENIYAKDSYRYYFL